MAELEASVPASPPPELTIHPMSFTGTGSEYFRIWIVNLALTIVTLGVYSAWAKVRRLQYFYRHTQLAGSGFDYHGDPIAILKGRIAGLMLFGAYLAISYVRFSVALAIIGVLALLVPPLMARALKFRLRNSSYRGIRFRFSGKDRSAYWVFLAMPFFTFLSLFTLGPLWHHRIKRYQVANATYGRSRFTFRAEVGEFYIAYVLAGAVFVAMVFAIMMVVVATTFATLLATRDSAPFDPNAPPGPAQWLAVVIVLVVYVPAVILVQSIIAARVQNAVWNTTLLESHRFQYQVSWFRLFGIQFTNLLATMLTLGLFRPFAQVRLVRYVTGVFRLVPFGSLDTLGAAESEDVTAVGEEAIGFFDFDIGF